jgi:hypothetical protein
MNAATFDQIKTAPVADVYVEIETESGTTKANNATLTQLAEISITHVVAQSSADDWKQEGPLYTYTLRGHPLYNFVESYDDTFKQLDISVLELIITAAVGVLLFDEDTHAELAPRTLFKATLVCGTRADTDDDEDDDELDPELLQLFRSVPLA